jgi:hypothetical protein
VWWKGKIPFARLYRILSEFGKIFVDRGFSGNEMVDFIRDENP